MFFFLSFSFFFLFFFSFNEQILNLPLAFLNTALVPSPTVHPETPQGPDSQESDVDDQEIAQQLVKLPDHVSPPASRPPQSGRVLRKDRKVRASTTEPPEPADPDTALPPSKRARTQEDLSVSTIPTASAADDDPSALQRVKQDLPLHPLAKESSSGKVDVHAADGTQSVAHSPSSCKRLAPENEVSADGSHAGTPNSASFPNGIPANNSTTSQTPNSAKPGVFPPDSSSTGTRTGSSTTSDPTSFRRRMLKTHSSVQSNPISSIFRDPVKESEAPGYALIIKRPMDLRTLAKKLRDGKVTSTEEYRRDLMLMLANAVMFNHEDSEVARHAKELMVECDRLVSIFMRGSRY